MSSNISCDRMPLLNIKSTVEITYCTFISNKPVCIFLFFFKYRITNVTDTLTAPQHCRYKHAKIVEVTQIYHKIIDVPMLAHFILPFTPDGNMVRFFHFEMRNFLAKKKLGNKCHDCVRNYGPCLGHT